MTRRIAIATPDWPAFCGGGIATLSATLAAGLADAGVEVEVWTRGGGRRAGALRAAAPAPSGVSVVGLAGRSWRRRGAGLWPRGMASAAARFRPDAVIAMSWEVFAGGAAGLPSPWVFAHGREITAPLTPARAAARREVLGAGVRWLCLTRWMEAELRGRGADRVHVVPAAVPEPPPPAAVTRTVPESAPPAPAAAGTPSPGDGLSARFGLPDEPKVPLRSLSSGFGLPEKPKRPLSASGGARPSPLRALCVGRLIPRKGQDVAIAAVRRLGGEVELRVVGDGPDRARLTALAAGCDHVSVEGHVDAATLERAWAAADVLVMPARTEPIGDTEGFGLVYLEAAARGVPSIGGAVAGVREAVGDGGLGLVLDDPTDPSALADLLAALHEDRARLAALGAGAREAWRRSGRPAHFAAAVLAALAHAEGGRAVALRAAAHADAGRRVPSVGPAGSARGGGVRNVASAGAPAGGDRDVASVEPCPDPRAAGAWVVAVRAALPSPRPQGWQAFQQAVGLAEAGVPRVTLVGDAGLPDGVPGSMEAWLGRSLPPSLTVVRPDRPSRPPRAGLRFRRALRRLRHPEATLLCRDPRVAAAEGGRGRWRCVVHEWHVRPEPGDPRHAAALRAADLHVTPAPGLADDLRAAGVPPERVLLLPNACGLDPARAARRAGPAAPSVARPAVLALGLHRRAGLDLALEAWRRDPDLPPLRLAGRDQGGVRVDAWTAVIDAHPALRGRVELVGPAWGAAREDLLDRAAAWLALYPHDHDTATRLCPLQVADALGSGLPVVATDLPSIRALVAGAPARLVPPGDPAALAAAVHAAVAAGRRLTLRPGWRDRAVALMGAASRRVASGPRPAPPPSDASARAPAPPEPAP